MKKAFTEIPCKLSGKIFIYGFFTVLCQLSFLYLSANIFLSENSPQMLRYIYIPYLEYPLACVAIIIGGALLVDWIFIRDFT